MPYEGRLRIQPRDKNAFTLIALQPAPYALQSAPNAPAKNKAPHFLRQPLHKLAKARGLLVESVAGRAVSAFALLQSLEPIRSLTLKGLTDAI